MENWWSLYIVLQKTDPLLPAVTVKLIDVTATVVNFLRKFVPKEITIDTFFVYSKD